ncbi:MAG TPA: cytochrome c biogenesis protein CcdA [Candidatus Babeliales bacterium]|nr:cytochrome c biogenesis protein CcdA [Candidatus Babeliales bacterium]
MRITQRNSLMFLALAGVCFTVLPIDSLEELFTAQHSLWVYVLTSFLAGLAVSFTPCIYPMIPITAGVLQAHQGKNHWHNFLLALTYVLGIASIYSALGYFVAMSGDYFGYWLSNPWFVLFMFIFFMYLAGSMFGFYDLKLPNFLTRKRASVKRGGSFLYTFVVGMVSGTVASPCVSPALIAILGFVAHSERPIVGILSLFAFTLGMSALLLLVGTFSSMLSKLPRAGMWMLEINRALGFLILFIGVNFILPFIPDAAEPILYGLIFLSAAVYYWLANTGIKKIIAVILFFLGIIFVFDPILSAYDVSLVNKLLSLKG